MQRLRIVGAQLDAVVGDLDGNAERAVDAYEEAVACGGQLVVLPELTLTGYPPEDLVFKTSFLEASRQAVQRVAQRTGEQALLVGFVEATAQGPANAAALCQRGSIVATYHKMLLPNYGVFDEERYFVPGRQGLVLHAGPIAVGVTICEDLWFPWGPLSALAAAGAQVIVSLNASPYRVSKRERLEPMLATRAADYGVHVVYVNAVGGQDELVFDGASVAYDSRGRLQARAPSFSRHLMVVDVPIDLGARGRLSERPRRAETAEPSIPVQTVRIYDQLRVASPAPSALPTPRNPAPSLEAEAYQALVVATRDYVRKNGFRSVVLGLSGGIDSSLVAAIAVDALGPRHVIGVSMPSPITSQASQDDAAALAERLQIPLLTIPIEGPVAALRHALARAMPEGPRGEAEENLQARARGVLLMGLSNQQGHLVLATGNKSELAVGYCTLYGDMAGGYSVIRDVPKTLVYRLARWRNQEGEPIPPRVLSKAPTAELRVGQLDSDSLPAYELLDPILAAYIEEDASVEELVGRGMERETVERVAGMVDAAEYKRRQAAPGPKITGRAFGKDRRLPITNAFRPTVPTSPALPEARRQKRSGTPDEKESAAFVASPTLANGA